MKKIPFILTGFFLLVFLLGCSDENGWSPINKGEEVILTLNLRVPGISNPATYALTGQDENKLETIDIFVFKEDGANETFLYQTHATDIDNNNKKFRAQLQKSTGSDKHRIVLVANARDAVDAVKADFTVGMHKDEVLEKITFETDKVWNTTSSTNFTPLPMWGETSVAQAITASTSSLGTISLMRAVARIDVGLDMNSSDEPQGFGDRFMMEDVKVYNANNISAIAPKETNITAGIATLPTLVSGRQLVTPAIAYNHDPTDFGFVREIYLGEADNKSQTDDDKMVCIIIGGYYTKDGDPVNKTEKTWYRLDFYNRDTDPQERLDILRNHRYRVNITSVDGPGYKTEPEAFSSRPINIKSEITVWNETPISNVVFDGQYVMGVSQEEFTFSREALDVTSRDNTLSVMTDYPTEWTVEKIVDASGNDINLVTNSSGWLKLSPVSGVSGSTTNTQFIILQNGTNSTRSAFVHLRAGRLSYIVKVNQLTTVNLGISITDVTKVNSIGILEFTAPKDQQPGAQQFILSWTPAAYNLYFTSTTLNQAFTFASGAGLDEIPIGGSLTDLSGTKTYTIQPPAISSAQLNLNPFYERSSIYLYSISDGIRTVNKTLMLRQYVYNMIPVIDDYYLMDGTQKSFKVRSNTPFTVEVKTDPNNVVSNISTTGNPNTSTDGTPVYFNIKDDLTNPSLYQQNVVVTIKSPTGLFADTDLTLNCISGIIQPESNSYIVAPNGIPILIPVSRANKSTILGNQLGVNEAFTAELVWTDNNNRIASNSNIKMIKATGSGTGGYVMVMPGSASGNAVVCIKNSSNKILWSWHIWVTTYAPSSSSASGTFMDRNLGATSNTPGQVGTKGLFYQWGRKDAFPGSTTIDGYTEPTLYSTSGTTSISKTVVLEGNNLANSVANPTTFYTNSSNPYDWYTVSSTGQNNTLWSPNTKTVYDPCPYGWRVPKDVLGTYNDWNDWNGYGRVSIGYGGFYPAAGYRSTSGVLNYTGVNGYYWTASYTDMHVYALLFASTLRDPFNKATRSSGLSVRCVKE